MLVRHVAQALLAKQVKRCMGFLCAAAADCVDSMHVLSSLLSYLCEEQKAHV